MEFRGERGHMSLEPVSEALFRLYRGTPQHGEWVIACLEGAWHKLIGDRLAGICRPLAFKNSKLVIEVTDESWELAVRGVETEMLERLCRATSGEIQSLSVRCKH